MLNLNELKAGRIYSFKHAGPVETVSYRKGENGRVLAPEWLKTVSITRESSFKGNCACPESYSNKMRKLNPDWQPSEKESWFQWDSRNGIVAHKKTGKPYLAIVNPQPIKSVYYVDGIEATPEQVEEIKQWRKGSGEFSEFALFDLEKVECQGVIE